MLLQHKDPSEPSGKMGDSEGGNSNSARPSLRTAVAFWILGLCNNYGYVVMLSAAHDILSDRFHADTPHVPVNTTTRDCNELSTGAILLADILPSVVIKAIGPFFPLVIHFRIALVILLSCAGYILVAEAPAIWVAVCGVVCTALAAGLGEVSLLAYMSLFEGKTAISNWGSGTGGAGFFGSFTYAGLTLLLGSPKATLYTLNIIPVLMGVAFWIILPSPAPQGSSQLQDTEPPFSVQDKIKHIPNLVKYMLPLFLVYIFEYFINQGLFELIQFELSWLTHGEQYKWYQVDYQLGVFISRSTLSLFEIRKVWLLALLQGINVVLFTTEALYAYLPHISLVFLMVLIEGLIAGWGYVNTFNRISKEVAPERRLFSMSFVSLSGTCGVALAGVLAIRAHNYICTLPKA